MNFRDLTYFVTAAKTNHFGKAAEACFVSQPTLSMQLKKLEDTLGVALFERDNKRVRLTRAGQRLLTPAQRILQEAEALKACAKSLHDPFAVAFHLGLFPTLSPYLLPAITPLIQQSMPKLSLYYVEEKTEVLLSQLEHGKLDAALIALPVDTNTLTATPLFVDPFMLALPINHPLAQKQSIKMDDIDMAELLLLEEGHCLRDQALSFCHTAPSMKNRHFTATSLATLIEMVALGHGITLIPKIATNAFSRDNLVFRPFSKPMPSRHIALVYRRHYSNIACCTKIATLIMSLQTLAPN